MKKVKCTLTLIGLCPIFLRVVNGKGSKFEESDSIVRSGPKYLTVFSLFSDVGIWICQENVRTGARKLKFQKARYSFWLFHSRGF